MKHCVLKPDAYTEYEKYFLPFNLPSSTTMPSRWYSSGNTVFDSTTLDTLVSSLPTHLPTLEEYTSQYKRQRGKRTEPVKDLIAKMEAYHTGSAELNNGDLSNTHIDVVSSALTALSVLRSIPVKYLHFDEDVRPPYCGTWTKCVSDRQMRSVTRNSTARIIEEINYDYDSEAEWAELGEGEDVDSDCDEDAESEDGEDDMDGFLDDEDDSGVRRNIGFVNSEVQCSGLQWENSSGYSTLATGLQQCTDLAANKIGFILGKKFLRLTTCSKKLTIIGLDPPVSASKPYSSTYWGGLDVQLSESTKNPPSRIPLAPKSDNFGNTLNVPNSTRRVGKHVDEVSKLLIPLKDLEKFKKAIVGRQETKQDLTKVLQKM
jgi:chromatin assembly factor 1 subunit A